MGRKAILIANFKMKAVNQGKFRENDTRPSHAVCNLCNEMLISVPDFYIILNPCKVLDIDAGILDIRYISVV